MGGEGKLKAVVGATVGLNNLEVLREECKRLVAGRGGRIRKVVT